METRNVNIDDENIPKEVKLSIEKLKKNPKNKNIRIEEKEYKINNNQLGLNKQSWGNPYKGYKKLYYKDWIIKSESSSYWTVIRNEKWGKLLIIQQYKLKISIDQIQKLGIQCIIHG